MEDSLAKLERIQTQIIERISKLELSTSASLQQFTATPIPTSTQNAAVSANEARLSAILLANDVKNFAYKRVPSDYYDWSLDARRDALGAASIHHLCKSIILKVIVVVIGYALRLAPEDKSIELTGFEHNAVTCVGMKTDIPVILDEAIEKLNPDFFWLGGGELLINCNVKTAITTITEWTNLLTGKSVYVFGVS
ncbi:uncharacterized protein [Malus domestica]|uniref:uncharacterized protein isoform X2 n=1 Tax=Malus domestica TaxID=3750 RepID=UPI003975EB15